MRPAPLFFVLLLLTVLLSGDLVSARQRRKPAKAVRKPRVAVRPALPAKRLVVPGHLSGSDNDALLTVFHRHKTAVVEHYDRLVSNTDVLDIKALVDAHEAGDTSAAPAFRRWWDVLVKIKKLAHQEFGLGGLDVSASLIHKRTPNQPGEPPAGGHPAHADNADVTDPGVWTKFFKHDGPAGDYAVTAIVFLNDNCALGDLAFFRDINGAEYSPEALTANGIKPETGKLVLFSSGPENLHAVGPVSPTHRDGTPAASRYTLNLWLSPEENAVLSNFPEVEKLLGETAA
jgi:hypothetical protein